MTEDKYLLEMFLCIQTTMIFIEYKIYSTPTSLMSLRRLLSFYIIMKILEHKNDWNISFGEVSLFVFSFIIWSAKSLYICWDLYIRPIALL